MKSKVTEVRFRCEEDILEYAKEVGIKNPTIDRCTSSLMTGWFNLYGDGKKLYGHWKETLPTGELVFGVYEPEEV